MAWQVSKRVWDHAKEIKQSDKVMLLALADKATEEGICWPRFDTSYDTLADMVGVNHRSAIRIIDNLCEAGHVQKFDSIGRGHSNTFIVMSGLTQTERENLIEKVSSVTPFSEEKVSSVTPFSEEKVSSVTPFSEEKVSSVTPFSEEKVSSVTPIPSINRPSINGPSPNGVGKKPTEEKQGPRWQLMNEFINRSGIPLPTHKPDQKYWWSQVGNIYEISLRDVDVGKKLICDALEKLRGEDLTVSDPGSLVKTARALMAQPKQKVRISPI